MQKDRLIICALIVGLAYAGIAAAQPAKSHIDFVSAPIQPLPSPSLLPRFETDQADMEPVSQPTRLHIPNILLDTKIEQVGLEPDGKMAIPLDDANAGWYYLGVKPGEPGQAVIDGHYNSVGGQPAVFYRLKELKIGDEIKVINNNNQTLTFRIYKREIYLASEFPISLIFGPSKERNLNLITCTGVFDPAIHDYLSRLVLFTRLKEG